MIPAVAVQLRCLVEAGDYVCGFDARVGVCAQKQARVIVDQIEDLDDLAVCQLPSGDVCLPALVGELRFEADQR